jgi:hypothetical protein
MSFKVTRLTIGKGKTVADEKAGKWERQYFELEAEIQEESGLELAKGSLESLIDTWLKGQTISGSPTMGSQEQRQTWDDAKIRWSQEEGAKGPFQKSQDVDSIDFKNLVKDLNAHQGSLYRDGCFFWLYKSGSTVGKKLKGKAKAPASQATQSIAEKFPEDLRGILSFEEKEDYIMIKPRQFLGSEDFAKIASVVRGIGGDYVSAGKGSHFRIAIKASK